MDFSRQFDESFSKYKDKPIVVYGLGDNAKKIFERTVGYNISALTAKDHLGESFFGRKVLPIEEAVNGGDILIIAAMPHATNIIYARIKDKVPRDFPVFDIRGHRLNMKASYEQNPYWKKTSDSLRREIEKHDIISFDVFDTLIVRRALYPQTVFEIVERCAREREIDFSFARCRIEAENCLYDEGQYPVLEEIYDELGRQQNIDSTLLRELMEIELATEKELISPRHAMVDIFNWAKSLGKIVVLASDMYLTSKEMEPILAKCGIGHYEKLFISCECKASKADGKLYDYIKEIFQGKSILHIGDNEIDDVEHAQEHSLDAYGILSPLSMLCASSIVHVIDSVKSIDDALLLGHILADVFQDPFALNKSNGKVSLSTIKALAEVCLLPITMRYMQFIFRIARQLTPTNSALLFTSRDCWFLRKLYHDFSARYTLPPGVYFYTSRQASTGAMVCDEHDIDVLCSDLERFPIKNLQQILWKRFQVEFPKNFNIDIEEAERLWGKDGLKKRIHEYKDMIFAASAKRREGYLNYLEQLALDKNRDVYLVDIITHGTAVYALGRMLGRKIHLIACFGDHLPNDYLQDMDFCNLLFGNIEYTSKLSGINQILELIYASSEDQLAGFSMDGTKKFVQGSKYNEKFLNDIQKEILSFLEQYFDRKWPEKELSNDFVAKMLDVLHITHSDIGEDVMTGFDFYDPLEKDMHCNALRRYRMSE